MARINRMLDDRWLTNRGPLVLEFEQRLAEISDVKHCISMCNGTIALEIAIRALGLQGEVIVPSFTFIATAHALQWQEITPVFCDIDPATYNIDPTKIESLLTPRTTGIIGVHLWGRPCAIDALQSLAERYGLALLFDAAHAFGCSHDGRRIGGFGDAEVFSFHATKFFNSFEGGAVATNDDELAEKIRLMQNFGFAGMDNVIHLGINGKMTEIAAAMGLTGLESLDEFIATNRRNYQLYRRELKGLPGLQMMPFNEAERRNYQYIVLEIDAEQTGIGRDDLMAALHAENVRARRYFYPGCHRMEPYRSSFPNAGLLLPETERLVLRTLNLPTGTSMDPGRVERTCALLRFLIQRGAEISARLNSSLD
jgi:dTDP-4-amino-4,6-dideoxygalactose transaminase